MWSNRDFSLHLNQESFRNFVALNTGLVCMKLKSLHIKFDVLVFKIEKMAKNVNFVNISPHGFLLFSLQNKEHILTWINELITFPSRRFDFFSCILSFPSVGRSLFYCPSLLWEFRMKNLYFPQKNTFLNFFFSLISCLNSTIFVRIRTGQCGGLNTE